MISYISHQKKVKIHRIKLLMMHEQRKNIFLFNVNKGDYRRLSDLDFFNEPLPSEDGPINSKNFIKQMFSQQHSKDEESSDHSRLLRVSMHSTPRE